MLALYVRDPVTHYYYCCLGWIRPVYSIAPRKLKLHDISVQHRRLTFEPTATTATATAAAAVGKAKNKKTTKKEGGDDDDDDDDDVVRSAIRVNIELLATPSFVQCESYRSAAHFYTHLHEQMLRCIVGSPDELAAVMHLPMGDPAFPFTVR